MQKTMSLKKADTEEAPAVRVFDESAKSLLASNGLILLLALIFKWKILEVMWIYWVQSVIIGFFNFRRMWLLKEFTTNGLLVNERPVDPTPQTRRQTSIFFAVHYGFFHFGYLVFLISEYGGMSIIDFAGIAACGITFFFNHRFSFHHNLKNDLSRKPNIGTLLFFPYARVVPMHLIVFIGAVLGRTSTLTLIIFLLLKTAADFVMHAVEHHRK